MSEYNIQMNKYNALNAQYDQLYPVTKIKDVDGLDTALQNKANTSSVYTKTETDTLLSRKAPAGYGYGDTLQLIGHDNITEDDFLAALESVYSNIPDNTVKQVRIIDHPKLDGGVHFDQLWRSSAPYGALIVYSYFGFEPAPIIRIKYNGVWYPWEYVNPPMELNKEYRTTERYLGKPVYTMMLPSVALGSAGSTAYIEGLANIKDIIDYRIQFQNASSGQTFAVNNWSKVKVEMHYDAGYAYASIDCIEDCSGKIAIGTFKYTKTTD